MNYSRVRDARLREGKPIIVLTLRLLTPLAEMKNALARLLARVGALLFMKHRSGRSTRILHVSQESVVYDEYSVGSEAFLGRRF